MNFMPMDSHQRTVDVDQITYEYGPDGSEQAAGSGVARPKPDGRGTFTADAQFSFVGNWWIKANVSKGNSQADVRFTVSVEPAQ